MVSASLTLTVSTSNTSLHGTSIAFKYNVKDSYSTDTLGDVDDKIFLVKFNYKCLEDTMALNGSTNIGVIDYLPTDGTVNIPVSYIQLYFTSNCPKSVKTEW